MHSVWLGLLSIVREVDAVPEDGLGRGSHRVDLEASDNGEVRSNLMHLKYERLVEVVDNLTFDVILAQTLTNLEPVRTCTSNANLPPCS